MCVSLYLSIQFAAPNCKPNTYALKKCGLNELQTIYIYVTWRQSCIGIRRQSGNCAVSDLYSAMKQGKKTMNSDRVPGPAQNIDRNASHSISNIWNCFFHSGFWVPVNTTPEIYIVHIVFINTHTKIHTNTHK